MLSYAATFLLQIVRFSPLASDLKYLLFKLNFATSKLQASNLLKSSEVSDDVELKDLFNLLTKCKLCRLLKLSLRKKIEISSLTKLCPKTVYNIYPATSFLAIEN